MIFINLVENIKFILIMINLKLFGEDLKVSIKK